MKILRYILLALFMTGNIKAAFQQVSSGKGGGLEIKVYAAMVVGDDHKPEIEVKVYLFNSSAKSFNVLTKFDYALLFRSDDGVTFPLVFGLGRSVDGVILKRSLEGFGEVTLNPDEATETNSFKIKLLEGEDPIELLKKIQIVYDVGPTPEEIATGKMVYKDLWCGRIVTVRTNQKQ